MNNFNRQLSIKQGTISRQRLKCLLLRTIIAPNNGVKSTIRLFFSNKLIQLFL